MTLVPKKLFFIKGIGYHKFKLGAFEQALFFYKSKMLYHFKINYLKTMITLS